MKYEKTKENLDLLTYSTFSSHNEDSQNYIQDLEEENCFLKSQVKDL